MLVHLRGLPTAVRKTYVPLTVGAPWNGAAGKSPTDTTSFGYAVHEGLAQPILEKYGFEYKAFVGLQQRPSGGAGAADR